MNWDDVRWNDWENSKQIPVGIFYNCCIYSHLFTIFSKPLQAKLISISTRAVPSQPHLEPEAAIPAVPWRPWHGSSVLEMLLKRNGWVAWTCLKSILKQHGKIGILYGHIWTIYWYIHGFGFQHDPTTQQRFLDVSCVNVWTTSAARTCPFRKPFYCIPEHSRGHGCDTNRFSGRTWKIDLRVITWSSSLDSKGFILFHHVSSVSFIHFHHASSTYFCSNQRINMDQRYGGTPKII